MISYLTGGIAKAKEWLADQHPFTGRFMADDGAMVNVAEFIRRQPLSIARGEYPGAEPFGAYGLRTSAAAETRFPVWPDGATIGVAYDGGAQLEIVSTSAQDAPGGTGMGYVSIHYLDAELIERDIEVTMNGLTPVQLAVADVVFVQCMHTSSTAGGYAAGTIVLRATVGGLIFSQIAIAAPRCSSVFRMVPKGSVLYIDGAVGSSISVTADTQTTLFLVANAIYDHKYRDPVIWVPFGSTGVSNGGIGFNFLTPQHFDEGTIVGGLHSSGKAATVGMSWYGHLEPAT